MDGQTFNFLNDLQNVGQRDKKCTELREEHAEYIPSFVVVACFLPCRAMGLPAPPSLLFIHTTCIGRRGYHQVSPQK